MTFKNVRIVDKGIVSEPGFTGKMGVERYCRMHHEDYPEGSWCKLSELGDVIADSFRRAEHLEPFEYQVVSYDIPRDRFNGLHRRQATTLLRRFDLATPSTLQTLQFASWNVVCNRMWKVLHDNDWRTAVALTPFHPEDPQFFRFGITRDHSPSGQQTFHHVRHARWGSQGDLYFGQGVNERYDTPLIIGVKPV